MKPKHIIIAAIILLSQKGFGQPYNHQIPNYYFDAYNTQTITKNTMNESVFVSVNEHSPNFGRDIELTKLDQNGNFLLSKRVLDSFGTLIPGSITATMDNGCIVAGSYEGHPTPLYPHIPGGFIHTTFYAKFDYNLNLVWFKLHYGYPIGLPNVIGAQIDPYGLVAVPSGPSEDYIVLNLTAGYDTITSNYTQRILIDKLDFFGNLVTEVHPTIPSNRYDINILSAISYLPANGICAITGGLYDYTSPSVPETPFIFTFDPGLTTVFNFTKYRSLNDNYTPSNVIEDMTNPSNLLFCFEAGYPTSYPMTCASVPKASSLVFMKVKVGNTGTILLAEDYTSPCMQAPNPPLIIKNIQSAPTDVMIGFTQIEPEALTGVGLIPALLRIQSTGAEVNYHLYNPTEPTNRLQYFDNYGGDSFIVHVNQWLNDSTQGTRIIKTDDMGRSFCTELPEVDTSLYAVTGIDTSLELIFDSTYLYSDTPVLNNDEFIVYPCDTGYARNSNDTKTNTVKTSSTKLYPIPANDNLNIIIGEDLNTIDKVFITNSVGQMLISKDYSNIVNNDNVDLDISNLIPGLYFIEISDKDANVIKRTFVKIQ